jgi:hypothetical protein
VSSTHALSGRLSRRSDISSIGDRWDWVGATSFLGCCESCLGFAGLTVVVAEACLGPLVTLGAELTVLPFFLVVVTSTRIGVSVTISGAGLGEGVFAAFTTRPPLTTWFQPGPRLSCSAEGSAGLVVRVGAPLTFLCTMGAFLTSAAFASFHLDQPQ